MALYYIWIVEHNVKMALYYIRIV